MLILLHN